MQRTVKLPNVSGEHFGYKSRLPVDVEISLTGAAGPEDLTATRVSIVGNVWRPNRSDIIAGGQMAETLLELYPGNQSVRRLVELWNRWHLNDLRPGCEHQTGPEWDTSTRIDVWHWSLDFSAPANRAAHDAERAAQKELRQTGAATLDAESRAELARPLHLTTYTDERPEGYKPDEYRPAHETKTAGWLRPEEHPAGLLGKECPTCGYHYGTAWKREELPADVARELAAWTFQP